MTVCLFSLMLGIITEMGVVTMQMCDASKGGYQEPDSDGIVRFKAHGPINRETRHGVTELAESDTNNLLSFSHYICHPRVIIRKNWILDTDIGTPENCNQLEVGISLTAMLLQTDQSSQCPHNISSLVNFISIQFANILFRTGWRCSMLKPLAYTTDTHSRSNPRDDQKLS